MGLGRIEMHSDGHKESKRTRHGEQWTQRGGVGLFQKWTVKANRDRKKIGEDHLRGELQEERRCSILVFNFSGEERRKEEGRTGG